ncbi:MAG: GntR family transcriptional regulator [Bacteroidota bacterium]
MEKLIFKNEIREVLLKHMLTGKYQPGERLSLPAIANELEVSVTPIREALTQLSETGIVKYIANRGFFLSELSAEEAQEIYELMALLESSALKKSAFSASQLDELDEINTNLTNATESMAILEFDRQFHQKLLENYHNNHAMRIISSLRVQISLYEFAFWNDMHKDASVNMHRKITHFIREGNLASAASLLEENWMISVKYIVSKLQKVN